MPTYAYSGLSSTNSSAELDESPRPTDLDSSPFKESLAGAGDEKRDVSELELADFEKIVDLVFREHEKLEKQRLLYIGSFLLVAGLAGFVSAFFASSATTSDLIVLSLTATTLVIVGQSMWQIIRRRRRTYQELAELVRETAPLFFPKLSLVRRAEIKIRLSNIGIYDPLKYR